MEKKGILNDICCRKKIDQNSSSKKEIFKYTVFLMYSSLLIVY